MMRPRIAAIVNCGGNAFFRFDSGAGASASSARFVDAAAGGDGAVVVGEEGAGAASCFSSFFRYFWA